LIDFIQDDDKLREERKKAKKNKDKYIGMSSDAMYVGGAAGSGGGGGRGGFGGGDYGYRDNSGSSWERNEKSAGKFFRLFLFLCGVIRS
jgi:epsin